MFVGCRSFNGLALKIMQIAQISSQNTFLKTPLLHLGLLSLHIGLTIIYFFVLVFWFTPGQPVLFGLLVVGEIYHTWQSVTYIYTIWAYVKRRRQPVVPKPKDLESSFRPPVV
jgi:hypothetical protein